MSQNTPPGFFPTPVFGKGNAAAVYRDGRNDISLFDDPRLMKALEEAAENAQLSVDLYIEKVLHKHLIGLARRNKVSGITERTTSPYEKVCPIDRIQNITHLAQLFLPRDYIILAGMVLNDGYLADCFSIHNFAQSIASSAGMDNVSLNTLRCALKHLYPTYAFVNTTQYSRRRTRLYDISKIPFHVFGMSWRVSKAPLPFEIPHQLEACPLHLLDDRQRPTYQAVLEGLRRIRSP